MLYTNNTETRIYNNRSFLYGLKIVLPAFKFARQASFWVTYSLEVKAHERGLTGKFEWRQRIIYIVKKV